MLHVRGSSKLPNFSPGTPTRDINTRSLAHDQHDTDESVIPLHRVYWERKFIMLSYPRFELNLGSHYLLANA